MNRTDELATVVVKRKACPVEHGGHVEHGEDCARSTGAWRPREHRARTQGPGWLRDHRSDGRG